MCACVLLACVCVCVCVYMCGVGGGGGGLERRLCMHWCSDGYIHVIFSLPLLLDPFQVGTIDPISDYRNLIGRKDVDKFDEGICMVTLLEIIML